MTRHTLLYRLAAALLLAWFMGGALASPLAACCVSDEPCCAPSPAGPGCASCATMPGVASAAPAFGAVAPTHAAPVAPDTTCKPVGTRPWKPPD